MEPKKLQPTTATTGGVILGKYQLGRLLGKGSFAKVYYAKSLNDDTSVAVKVIDKAKTVDAAMEPRIVREVSAMRRLSNHPNILKIHEVLATKSKIYLVMELASAGDLSSALIRRRRFPETTARRYFQQLVSALHFCHRHGVSHRDIKPQNLLLDSAGTLKISDFGLSALHEGGSVNNLLLHTACGTPAFAAPEVACRRSGAAGYDGEKADAWSCGVILFLFLTGTLPFDDSNLSTMYRKIHRREFEFPQFLSKQSRFIIRQLLDPNPNSRMSIETLMNQSWFKKSLQLQQQQQQSDSSSVTYQECKSTYTINAFDIISMSSGLDLSGLFESNNRREKRFTSKESVEVVEGRVLEVSGSLGFRVEREKGRGIGLKKGRAVLVIEIVVVAEELVVVLVKVVDGGVEFEEVHWDGLRVGLEGMSLSCHNDVY